MQSNPPLFRGSLSEFTVREHAEAIAREMFDAGSFGLEIPLATLVERLPNQRIEVTAELLAILRIGRISPGSRAFTFVHRRFNEYFLVNRFRLEPNLVPLEAIVQDTRLRDAIALYSSIAETAESKRIIAYCVAELQPLMSGRALAADSTYRRGLHALRFLVDAFRGREDLLALYSKQFAEFIGERLAPRADLLLAKNAVEAIGLTSSEDAPALIAKALESRDRWLLEMAVRNARYLPRITEQAKELVERYFLTLPRWQLIGRQAAAVRVLALSEHFANMVQRNLWLRLEFVVVVAVFVITALVSPLSLIFSLYLVATLGVVSLAGKLIALIGTEQMLPKVKELIGTEQILAKVKELIGTEWIWDPLLPLRKLGRTLREPECHRRDLSGHLRANTFLGGAAITSSVITIGVAALLLFTEGTEWAFLSPIYFLTANRLEEGLALAVIGLAGLPWYSLVRFAKSQFLHLRLSSLCRLLGIAAVVGAAEIALVWVSNGIPRRLLHVFYITAGIAIGLLILLGVTKALAEYIRGQRQARRWLQRFDGRRATITAAYQDIRTAQGRTTFIAGVAASAPRFRSALESPENVWPDGSRPNRGDAASTRLAQLEEVWLRLDQ